jgi:hypothetical protein
MIRFAVSTSSVSSVVTLSNHARRTHLLPSIAVGVYTYSLGLQRVSIARALHHQESIG